MCSLPDFDESLVCFVCAEEFEPPREGMGLFAFHPTGAQALWAGGRKGKKYPDHPVNLVKK